MSKGRKSSDRKIIYIFLFILVAAALGLLVWKVQEKLAFDTKKIEFPNVSKNESIYNSYKVTSKRAAKDTYYVTFENVVCDAASDYGGGKHYFRITLSLETNDDKTAKNLAANEKAVIEELRAAVSDIKHSDTDRKRVMDYVKSRLKTRLDRKFGPQAIKGIYFEELLSQ